MMQDIPTTRPPVDTETPIRPFRRIDATPACSLKRLVRHLGQDKGQSRIAPPDWSVNSPLSLRRAAAARFRADRQDSGAADRKYAPRSI